jgi:hypothetical protein
VSYPDDLTPTLASYFGENAEITAIVEISGQKYYEITSYYFTDCDTVYDEYTPTTKLITIYLADADTFEITKVRRYMDTIDAANLIITIDTTNERRKVSFTEVASDFQFPYQVPLKTVDYAAYTFVPAERMMEVTDYLKVAGVATVEPVTDNMTLYSAWGSNFPETVANEKYYLQRDYYANNAKGEARYQRVITANAGPIFSAYYSGENHMSVNAYNDQDLLTRLALAEDDTYYGDEWRIQTDNVQINMLVGDTMHEVSAYVITKWYTIPGEVASYPGSYPTSYPSSYPGSEAGTQLILSVQQLLFSYGNYTYEIYIWSSEYVDLAQTQYRLIRTTVSDEFAYLQGEILRAYEGQANY